ncbi:MAG TPA: hypothetical protein VF469_29090 [Kofleriaceae bacterium]
MHRTRVVSLSAIWLVISLATARAEPAAGTVSNWAATFSPPTVVAYHRPASVAVVAVAKPGRPGAEARAAAGALLAAYRAAGIVKVKDGSTLGAVSEAEDAAIVARAAALAVDKVAIVRAFVEGPSVRAIVTVYGADRQLVTGFSAVAGEALAAPAATPGSDGSVADQIMRTRSEPSLDKDGVVRLWVQSQRPGVQLLRTSVAQVTAGGATGTVGYSKIVCLAPCGVVVDGSLGEAFTFGVQEAPATDTFQLVGWKGDVTAHVKPVNPGLRRYGLYMMLFGGGAFLWGGLVARNDSAFGGMSAYGTYEKIGLIGGAAGLVAGYLMFHAGAPEVTLTPGRPQ